MMESTKAERDAHRVLLGDHRGPLEEVPMAPMLKRHQVQVLIEAGHSQSEVSEFSGLGVRTVRRIRREQAVEHVDDARERERRRIGRPSIAEPFRSFVKELMEKEPGLLSVEILRRATLQGYGGGKSAV